MIPNFILKTTQKFNIMRTLFFSLVAILGLFCQLDSNAQVKTDAKAPKTTQKQKEEKAKCLPKYRMMKFDATQLVLDQNFSFGYETNINEHFTYGINATYFNNNDREANEAIKARNKQFAIEIQPEFRHYFIKTDDFAPNGIYYAPFVNFGYLNKKYLSYDTNLANVEFDQQKKETRYGAGIKLGFQQHIFRGFYLDAFAGPQYQNTETIYSNKLIEGEPTQNISTKTGDNSQPFDEYERLNNKGWNLQYGLKLSFAF